MDYGYEIRFGYCASIFEAKFNMYIIILIYFECFTKRIYKIENYLIDINHIMKLLLILSLFVLGLTIKPEETILCFHLWLMYEKYMIIVKVISIMLVLIWSVYVTLINVPVLLIVLLLVWAIDLVNEIIAIIEILSVGLVYVIVLVKQLIAISVVQIKLLVCVIYLMHDKFVGPVYVIVLVKQLIVFSIVLIELLVYVMYLIYIIDSLFIWLVYGIVLIVASILYRYVFQSLVNGNTMKQSR